MVQQNRVVKQQIHEQMSRLRESFVRNDARLTGTIPGFMLPYCLKSGGLELPKEHALEACQRFRNGDGRFQWDQFCLEIEKARKANWSQASRVKSLKAFQEIDKDGSGRLSREELEGALKRWKISTDKDKVDALVKSCDSDGDGNISYAEFVDCLSKDLLKPTSIWGNVPQSPRGGPSGSPRHDHGTPRGR